MRKSELLRRRKYTTNTYMREAIDFDTVIIKEEDLCICIKKYIKMKEAVILSDNEIYIDEGYYVVELTPLKEHYNIRYYFDSHKHFIDTYIDISFKNGMEYQIPYYTDIYLDILHNPKNDSYFFVDEDELEEALKMKRISKKDYELAYKVGNKLLQEVRNHTNKYYNIDVQKYLEEYF